jgi:hypothetical protein
MPNQNYQPSQAGKPDLDWSQVRETVLMLNLAVAQISSAMQDGDESVNTLTESFTSLAADMDRIRTAGEELPPGSARTAIMQNSEAASQQIHAAIVAFQFYDKLSQRLAHLTNSLGALGSLVATPEQLYDPAAWRGLQERIKSQYTVEADKAMFEAILQGKSVAEAITLSQAKPANAEDAVELF